MYLIYDTEQEALDRAEQEGIKIKLSFHVCGKGSRYVGSVELTDQNKYALDVSDFILSSGEASATVDSYTPMPVEE